MPPGGTSSSPVESTATFGRRTTSTSAMPQAASMPISRDEMRVPRRSTIFAARDVGARIGDELAGRDRAPHVDGRRCTSSTSSVCSIITTASAPRGTTPPVAIVVAVPGMTASAGA